MDRFNMLSGDQLVELGGKKGRVSLPEVGLKEVFPNGSWLEQKQIQNALEARKHLLEVERIEKCGAVSHAEWRDDLQLAEVTQKCGSYWQYVGHNVGKSLFIYPEEALLLLETVYFTDVELLRLARKSLSVIGPKMYNTLPNDIIDFNCLHLKYNDVTVSIQQAYSLLLTKQVPLYKYKVYAGLSRLGYKVLRYDPSLNVQTKKQTNEEVLISSVDPAKDLENGQLNEEVVISTEVDPANIAEKEDNNTENSVTMEVDLTVEVSSSVDLSEDREKMDESLPEPGAGSSKKGSEDYIRYKLDVLCSREVKPCNSRMVHESFNEHLPDLSQAHVIVTVKAPNEKHLPRNVFLNNTAYVLNLASLRLKRVTPAPSSSSQAYSSSDDANDSHVGRIKSSVSNESLRGNWSPQFFPNTRYPQQRVNTRPFNYWNHFNFAFQRAFFPMPQSFHIFPRMHQPFRFYPPPNFAQNVRNDNPGRAQKRKRVTTKTYHFESIRKLSSKLKRLVALGIRQVQNIESLQKLIQTYNIRYRAMLQLTEQLDIVENEIIVDTIDLEDDDQSSPEKRQKNANVNFEENLNALKKLALKMKELEEKNELSPRHRRAFSNAIKTFNKSYDADIYVDSKNEVIDRRLTVIASSSESDHPRTTPKEKKSRKLRNPFYIMKQLAEKKSAQVHLKQNQLRSNNSILIKDFKYSDTLKNTFGDWLPSEEDFGRAEVVDKEQKKYWLMNRMVDHSKDILYEFMKEHSHNNWLEAKKAYWESCRQSAETYEDCAKPGNSWSLNSIIGPDDGADIDAVLQKLSIIKTNKDVKEECSLKMDFDVYNRNVQNFKKTNKPKPHFRVICLQEDSPFPCGIDIATLHSKNCDEANIVFAIVGTSSVTYLQVNTTDLPICVASGSGL